MLEERAVEGLGSKVNQAAIVHRPVKTPEAGQQLVVYQGDTMIAEAGEEWIATARQIEAVEDDQRLGNLTERAGLLEHRMRAIVSRSLLGLQAKASVIQAMMSGRPGEMPRADDLDDIESMVASLVDDILRLEQADLAPKVYAAGYDAGLFAHLRLREAAPVEQAAE